MMVIVLILPCILLIIKEIWMDVEDNVKGVDRMGLLPPRKMRK